MERGQATRPRRSPRSTAGRRVATSRRPAYGRPRGRRRDGGIRECRAGLTDGAWPRWRRRCWRSRARRARGRASTRWPRSIPSGPERRRPRRSRPATSTATALTDLVASGVATAGGDVSILPGRAAGPSAPARVFAANARPQGVAVADFDEDGFTDVVAPRRHRAVRRDDPARQRQRRHRLHGDHDRPPGGRRRRRDGRLQRRRSQRRRRRRRRRRGPRDPRRRRRDLRRCRSPRAAPAAAAPCGSRRATSTATGATTSSPRRAPRSRGRRRSRRC